MRTVRQALASVEVGNFSSHVLSCAVCAEHIRTTEPDGSGDGLCPLGRALLEAVAHQLQQVRA
jgi:hypothetical protein